MANKSSVFFQFLQKLLRNCSLNQYIRKPKKSNLSQKHQRPTQLIQNFPNLTCLQTYFILLLTKSEHQNDTQKILFILLPLLGVKQFVPEGDIHWMLKWISKTEVLKHQVQPGSGGTCKFSIFPISISHFKIKSFELSKVLKAFQIL